MELVRSLTGEVGVEALRHFEILRTGNNRCARASVEIWAEPPFIACRCTGGRIWFDEPDVRVYTHELVFYRNLHAFNASRADGFLYFG